MPGIRIRVIFESVNRPAFSPVSRIWRTLQVSADDDGEPHLRELARATGASFPDSLDRIAKARTDAVMVIVPVLLGG